MKDKKNVAQILGENLKRIRLDKGVSRKDLAAVLIVSESIIGQYENEKKLPPLDKIFTIADFLNVPITDLTGGNPNFIENKIFEYRLQRAYQMARDFLDSLLNAKLNFDKEGLVVVHSPEKITYKNGVASFHGGYNSVAFQNKLDFVNVMERAENDALRQRIDFNAAFRQIVFGEKPPK